MVGGEKDVKARFVARGYQGPALRGGLVDASGRVSLRASNLQVLSLGALKKWETCSLDNRNTFLRAGGFHRVAFIRSPAEWDPSGPQRIRKLRAPAYGLNDAPPAFRKTLQRYLLCAEVSLALLA